MVINEKRYPGLAFFMPGYNDKSFLVDRVFECKKEIKKALSVNINIKDDCAFFYVSKEFSKCIDLNKKSITNIIFSEYRQINLYGIYIVDKVVTYVDGTAKLDKENRWTLYGSLIAFNEFELVSAYAYKGNDKAWTYESDRAKIAAKIDTSLYFQFIDYTCHIECFKKYADIQSVEIKGHKNKKIGKVKTANRTPFDITYLDSSWYTEITRSEGFNVNGHFRLQPYKKDGQWTKKLIWINQFRKNGYHRRAKKQIIEENK